MTDKNFILHAIESPEDYTNTNAIENTIRYACKLDNPSHEFFYGIWPPTREKAIEQFELARKLAHDTTGMQVHHFYITAGKCQDVAFILQFSHQVALLFTSQYQVCFALHDDRKHLHTHFVISTAGYIPDTPPLTLKQFREYIPLILETAKNNGICLEVMS